MDVFTLRTLIDALQHLQNEENENAPLHIATIASGQEEGFSAIEIRNIAGMFCCGILTIGLYENDMVESHLDN